MSFRRVGKVLLVAGLLALGPVGYWLGYQDGFRDWGSQMRAIVLVNRNPTTKQYTGQSYLWYHVGNPIDVMRMRSKERELKAAKSEFFIAKGKLETSLDIEPDPERATAHP